MMLTAVTPQYRFDRMILPNRNALTAQAMHLTGGDRNEAEDLVQETLLRAYTHLDTVTSEETVRAWLHTILRNLFINRYHRQARAPRWVSLDSIPDEVNLNHSASAEIVPETIVEKRMERCAALNALAALPLAYREAVVLADVEELPYQEIADRLHLPLGTVRSRIARGRARIQRSLYAWRRA